MDDTIGEEYKSNKVDDNILVDALQKSAVMR